ncbi:MAG: NADH pyrophosphatase zinc ribbon domain-containing protein [Enterocloster sp.]
MIQDIGEHRFDLSFRQPEARDEDYVLYMKSNKTLLRKAEDGNYEIPRFSDFPMEKVRLKMKAYYLFAIDGTGYYYVREMLQGEEDGYEFCPTSVFRKMTPMYQAFAGITATQLHRWKESRRFCGRCGHETEDSKTERAVVCPFCGQTEYPKICPAVMAITDGDRIILSDTGQQ